MTTRAVARGEQLCYEPRGSHKGPGRPPASVYEVNPTLMRRPANPVNPENSMGASNSQDLQDSQDGF